jgi:hypothetical protein
MESELTGPRDGEVCEGTGQVAVGAHGDPDHVVPFTSHRGETTRSDRHE